MGVSTTLSKRSKYDGVSAQEKARLDNIFAFDEINESLMFFEEIVSILVELYQSAQRIDFSFISREQLNAELAVLEKIQLVHDKVQKININPSVEIKHFECCAMLLEPVFLSSDNASAIRQIQFMFFFAKRYASEGQADSLNKYLTDCRRLLKALDENQSDLIAGHPVTNEHDLVQLFKKLAGTRKNIVKSALQKSLDMLKERRNARQIEASRLPEPNEPCLAIATSNKVASHHDDDVVIGNTKVLLHTDGNDLKQERVPRNDIEVSTASSEVPIPGDAAQIAIILGHQRTQLQKNHLKLNTAALSQLEIKSVINTLKTQLSGESSTEKSGAAVTLLCLLTSKPFDDVSNLLIAQDLPQNREGIDIHKGIWRRRDVPLPHAFSPTSAQQKWLKKHHGYVDLPLPPRLLAVLKELLAMRQATAAPVFELCKSIETTIRQAVKPCAGARPIRPAAIRYLMFHQIAAQEDAGIAMLLLANTEYDNPHHLYYLSCPHRQLKQIYAQQLKALSLCGEPPSLAIRYGNAVSGSQNALDVAAFNTLIRKRYEDIEQRIAVFNTLPMEACVDLYNDAACYTTLMLVAATNHRIRQKYTYTHERLDLKNGYVLVSDKMHQADSAIRILPLSGSMREQIDRFSALQSRVVRLIERKDSVLFQRIVKQLDQHEIGQTPFILFSLNTGKIKKVGHRDLSDWLGEDWCLPLNTFRHLFCSELRSFAQGANAQDLMGHVNAGEHVDSDFSLHQRDENEVLKQSMESMLTTRLAFKVISPLRRAGQIRKRVPKKSRQQSEEPRLSDEVQTVFSAYFADGETYDQRAFQQKYTEAFYSLLTACAQMSDAEKELAVEGFNDSVQTLCDARHYSLHAFHSVSLTDDHLVLNDRCLQHNQTCEQQHQNMTHYFEKIINNDEHPLINKIVLSILLYSPQKTTLRAIVTALQGKKVIAADARVWLELDGKQRLILDSVSALLVLAFLQQDHHEIELSGLNAELSRLFQAECLIYYRCDVDALLEQFAENKWHYLSSNEHALSAQRIQTTPLSNEALSRFLTGNRYGVDKKEFAARRGERVMLPDWYDFKIIRAQLNSICSELTHLTQRSKANYKAIVKNCWTRLLDSTGDQEKSVTSLLNDSEYVLPSSVIASLYYLYKLCERDGKNNRDVLAVNTIKNYLSQAVQGGVLFAYDDDIFSYDSDEWLAFYTLLLSSKKDKKARIEKAKRLRDFHRTVAKKFKLPGVAWSKVEPSIADDTEHYADANILTEPDYQHALKYIRSDPLSSAEFQHCASLLLMLSYRAGLRPCESWHLERKDFEGDNDILHIRTKPEHRLKTPASNRRIPLNLFLDKAEIELLDAQKRRTLHHHQRFIFDRANGSLAAVSVYITNVLREVTADHTLCLYHARHSFASYLFLLFSQKSHYLDQAKAWVRQDNVAQFKQRLFEKTVIAGYEDKSALLVLARLMGHTQASTTFQNYIHLADLSLSLKRDGYFSNKWNVKQISILQKINYTNLRKQLSRSDNSVLKYRSLIKATPNYAEYELNAVEREHEDDHRSLYHESKEDRILCDYHDQKEQFRVWLLTRETNNKPEIHLCTSVINDFKFYHRKNVVIKKKIKSIMTDDGVYALLIRISKGSRADLDWIGRLWAQHINAQYALVFNDSNEAVIKNMADQLSLLLDIRFEVKKQTQVIFFDKHNKNINMKISFCLMLDWLSSQI